MRSTSGVVELTELIGAFLAGINNNYTRPTMNWSIDEASGNITVTTGATYSLAYGDSGLDVSTGKRDFRWAALNVTDCPIKEFGGCLRPLLWTTTDNVLGPLTYRFSFPLDVNPNGWRAFIVEMQWPNPFDPLLDPLYFSSPASVVPPTYPFKDCWGVACKGELV